MTQQKIRWGILGPGNIANAFAGGVKDSELGVLQAVGSRSKDRADAFADKWDIPNRHGSYEDLLADDSVDAVYISTPHPQHPQWVWRAAEAGKHILCEKPVGLNATHAMAAVEAAQRHDVFFMEAYMYRCSPQTAKLVELVKSGKIGEVKLIRASFAFRAGDNPDSRLISNDLGGGGILDVGGYPMSMARLIAGAALGKDFANPTKVQGLGKLHETQGIDEYAIANLEFEGNILAQIATGVRLTMDNKLHIFGTEGNIVCHTPWIPAKEGGTVTIDVTAGGKTETIEVTTDKWLYGLEADMANRNIANRQATPPAMTWDDTLGQFAAIDQWKKEVGLVYNAEKTTPPPIHGRELKVADDHGMRYSQIKHLDRKVSRLVMGCDNQQTIAHGAAMWDDFYERGGNTFDTGYIYGGGLQEKLLGQWIKDRGIRDQVNIISKGAHSPNCFPHIIGEQLDVSLDRLQTDVADIYFMHRDNLEIPVGEFVDALNEEVDKGRIKAFGGSNWTIARVKEANEYAAKNGKQGFTALSNNFSLARMVDPVWAGCVAASDPDSKAFLEEHQIALMPWSSQARGFFVRAARDFKDDAELVRCWYSDENFERLERNRKLAKEKGVTPINIALAFVLHQKFPTFPLIGPRTLWETRTSWPGLTLDLTEEEIKWLNLDD